MIGDMIDRAKSYVHHKPTYRIDIDGVNITGSLAGRLIDMTLTDNAGFEVDTVEIRLDDSDGRLALPPRNREMRAWIGWQHTGLVDKGSYVIDEVRHSGAPDVITIRARSADLRSGLTTQRERSWHEVTINDIVKTLADENDLLPMVDSRLGAQHIAHIDQTNESAANLLTRLAREHDAVATVKDKRLLFLPASSGLTLSGLPLPTLHIERSSGDQHEFSIADRDTYAGVKAIYNDVDSGKRGEVIWGKAENSAERGITPAVEKKKTTGQYKGLEKTFPSREAALRAARKEWKRMKGNAAARAAWTGVSAKYKDRNLGVDGEVRYGQDEDEQSRRKAVKQAEEDKRKADDEPLLDRGSDNIKTLRHVYSSRATAMRGARAAWRRLQRGAATFSITLALGRPEAIAGVPVRVSGWKRDIDGTKWVSKSFVHTLTDAGLTSKADLEMKASDVADDDALD